MKNILSKITIEMVGKILAIVGLVVAGITSLVNGKLEAKKEDAYVERISNAVVEKMRAE